jgi:hypothetical protein
MITFDDVLLAFLAASALITIAPGPDNLMVLSVGISRGRAPASASASAARWAASPIRCGRRWASAPWCWPRKRPSPR